MDMLLRLRADGYHVGHIHSDQGHEFQGRVVNVEFTSLELLVMIQEATDVLKTP